MIGGVGQRVVQEATVRQPQRDLQAQSGNGQRKSAADMGVPRRPGELRQIQAGFGDNTQSSIAAAMDTLDITLQDSRKIVPSIQELMAEVRSRRLAESKAPSIEAATTAPPEQAPSTNVAPESKVLGSEQPQRTASAEVRVPASYRTDSPSQSGKNVAQAGLLGDSSTPETGTSIVRFDVKV